ncbi:hypothetical protein VMCG_03391 [Cytospora schulzeri]|uniref:Uncharacterized protein n=1 Tax=Cytospora schulzeri TaxID=448051 RepID=A0A423WWU4_9PEZI|nr:hypothetical protein VMCG_03391 [Valsa malicola]
MKGRPIDQLVYEQMFPKGRPQDPQNFHALLQRHLILEVRQEVHSFYGHLDTCEAKYPGLDYTNPIHRIRLSRWQWHRRLFRAFDALRLTPNEIAALTKWEGTRWAKERYEREQHTIIRDTAADEMPQWVEPEDRIATPAGAARHIEEDLSMSVGIALNERLRARVAARNAGDVSLPVDEAWEQWFKNAVETGEISHMRERIARESPQDLFPPRFIDAARAGSWHEIPEFLRDLIRDGLRAEENRLRGRSTWNDADAPAVVITAPRPAHIRPRSSLLLPRYGIPDLLDLDPCQLQNDEQNATLRGGEGPTWWNPWIYGDEGPGSGFDAETWSPDNAVESWGSDDTVVGSDAPSETSTGSHAYSPDGETLVCESPASIDGLPTVPHTPGGHPITIITVVILVDFPVAMPRPIRACIRHPIDQLLEYWGATSRSLQLHETAILLCGYFAE